MLQELVPCSDPNTRTVRITDAVVLHPVGGIRILYRAPADFGSELLDSPTSTIRHSNLDEMCFDCRSVHTDAHTIASVTYSTNRILDLVPKQDRSRMFAATITQGRTGTSTSPWTRKCLPSSSA